MLSNEQRAHDFACSVLSNSELTKSIARDLPKNEDGPAKFEIDVIYDILYTTMFKKLEKAE